MSRSNYKNKNPDKIAYYFEQSAGVASKEQVQNFARYAAKLADTGMKNQRLPRRVHLAAWFAMASLAGLTAFMLATLPFGTEPNFPSATAKLANSKAQVSVVHEKPTANLETDLLGYWDEEDGLGLEWTDPVYFEEQSEDLETEELAWWIE